MIDRRLYKIVEDSLGTEAFQQYTIDQATRITVQKALYLMSHGNENPKLKLPYRWTFYLRGPFSSNIAHMIYYTNDLWDNLQNKPIELKDGDSEVIDHFKSFKDDLQLDNLSESVALEIATIIVYASIQIGRDFKKLMNLLLKFKLGVMKNYNANLVLEPTCRILSDYDYI